MVRESIKDILEKGSIRLKVKRAGMLQFQVFVVKRIKLGNMEFPELFLNKVIDVSELSRISNEIGLPVEAKNGRAFPEGTMAKDFVDL